MKQTLIEKILSSHADSQPLKPGDVIDLSLDARVARDFGGANVVGNLERAGLVPEDRERTFFTFDCNPCGSDQGYAANQHRIRLFAREHGIRLFDIDRGIGTHLAVDHGFAWPGSTLVSTDSHANILGAIGAFGQGMGDLDIAQGFARGKVWFQVPPTVEVILKGRPGPMATPKDIGLALLKHFGAAGLLGMAAEIKGDLVESLGLDGRMTISSMATEMGAIIALFAPSAEILSLLGKEGVAPADLIPDKECTYANRVEVDVEGLGPQVSRPGHPEDVVDLEEVRGEPVDSIFIGSCTNGRLSDLRAAAKVMEGRKIAPHRVLKVVPATDATWMQAMEEGLFSTLKESGALIANAGCAGCAAGQVGQNGPGEVTVSTGNRNFAGKQGKGAVWLASPAVAAASAAAGLLTDPTRIPETPKTFSMSPSQPKSNLSSSAESRQVAPVRIEGVARVVSMANIDTDMIYHNRHLAVTDLEEMGSYTFGNLPGWESFPESSNPGEILVLGPNFGAGSSRQHAVDCFKALGSAALLASSFGAIYERNAVNSALPILKVDLISQGVEDGESLRVDFVTGEVTRLATGQVIQGPPMSEVQLAIYKRGGLLAKE